MKNILRLLVLAIMLIPTSTISAQTDTVPAPTTTPPPPTTTDTATTPPASTAPAEEDKKFYKGLRFGYQTSNFSESDFDDLSAFYVGIFGVKKLGAGKLLMIYSGIEYFQNGASDDGDNEVILGYISIPINLRVQIGPIYAFGGFNPSFKIYEKATFLGQDFKDQLDANGFDIGGQVGLGIKILFLGAEVKYNQGLIGVFDDPSGDENTSHHVQAGLCVYF